MQYSTYLLLLFQSFYASGVHFFHERSAITLTPESGDEETFGFSLAYQNRRNNLVVGAPHSGSTGKVFNCPIQKVQKKTVRCTEADFDIDSLAPYDREYQSSVKLNLGYSVSATDDYIFTCAPLWTTVVQLYPEVYRNRTVGTCFLYNNTAYRYKNFIEIKGKKIVVPTKILDGNGWKTFVDKDWLIILKVAGIADVAYVKAGDALAPVDSLVDPSSNVRRKARDYLHSYWNIGYSIAAGQFFSNKTVYAISGIHKKTYFGAIHFIESKKLGSGTTKLFLQRTRTGYTTIDSKGPPGSMYGAAMSSAHLDLNSLSELLVGEPAWFDKRRGCHETGALHIYLGGDVFQNAADTQRRHRVILGKDGSRFGTAVAVNDLDGDNLSEIFVSAPYENSGQGALYIFLGREIYEKLTSKVDFVEMSISQLIQKQRIENKYFKTFGYSLHVIPDLDGNGCDELAVGSPKSKNIMILHCLPSVNVTLVAKPKGDKLQLRDRNFTLSICIIVEGFENVSLAITFDITNEVEGNGVYMDSNQTTLSVDVFGRDVERNQTNCVDVKVMLDDYEPGDYVFRTRAKMDQNKIINAEDLKNAVLCSTYSKLDATVTMSRRCDDDVCVPILVANLTWFGGNITDGSYDVGSSDLLTANVVITNLGRVSWKACALVTVKGATVSKFGCEKKRGSYECLLPEGFEKDEQYPLNIYLNMSKPMNKKEIEVRVYLYDFCGRPRATNRTIESLQLHLNTEDIILTGLSHDQNISDIKIQDKKHFTECMDAHEYWIENTGEILWSDIVAKVVVYKQPFISSCRVEDLSGEHLANETVFTYKIDLPPGSKKKIIASCYIPLDKIMENLRDNKLTVQSSLSLHLLPTSVIINKSLSSNIIYKKEKRLGHNKTLIISVAVAVAAVALIIMIFILKKIKYFTSPVKTKLAELQEELRIRRESVVSQHAS